MKGELDVVVAVVVAVEAMLECGMCACSFDLPSLKFSMFHSYLPVANKK